MANNANALEDSPLPMAKQREFPMEPHEVQAVSLDGRPVHGRLSGIKNFRIASPVVAEIKAGKQLFSVLDIRERGAYDSPLLVVTKPFRVGSDKNFKGLWLDEEVVIGRSRRSRHRFDYDPTVSVAHFSLAYDGLGLIVTNFAPTNATLLTGDLDRDRAVGQDDVRDIFTELVDDDMRGRHDFGYEDESAPYGYFKNHRIIGRNTTIIKDGVYFTTRPNSEAVVVDNRSRALQRASGELLRQVERKFGKQPTVPVESMLNFVNRYVQTLMPYDREGAEALSEPNYANNGLIGLSEYVERGAGVCRHQCLLAAFLLEELVEKRVTVGRVGVERNHDVDAHGAHAWAVFEMSAGQLYVVDPAQNFVGTKQKAAKEKRWKYNLRADR